MSSTRVAALMKELKLLESKSNKLWTRAYKRPYAYASDDWRAYRKVYSRLKSVKKQIGYHLELSQDTFYILDPVVRLPSFVSTNAQNSKKPPFHKTN
jgi:hypothetical protein